MSQADGASAHEELMYAFETDKVFFTEESPELTMGRFDWSRQRQRAELVVFLSRKGVAGEVIKMALGFLEEVQDDMHWMLEAGLDLPECTYGDDKKCLTVRHPAAAELEAKMDLYRDGEPFTVEDFAAMNELEVDTADLDLLPEDIREIMSDMANKTMRDPSPHSEEIMNVMQLSNDALLQELEGLD